jgi:hypothetical protein
MIKVLLIAACMGCALSGCASARTVPQREAEVLTRDYVAEVLRYLYRWYADETMLASVSQHADTELWVRPLHPDVDAGDDSRFCEILFPRVHMRLVLKQADYLVEELGQRVRNESFKVHSVGEYSSLPAPASAYTVFRFDRGELSDYLFRTRNDRVFPDEELRERLRAAVRKAMGESPADVEEGPAVVYVAPLSPVSNDLWVYWENGHRIIRFSSDADLTRRSTGISGVDVHVYDLRERRRIARSAEEQVRDRWAARVSSTASLGRRSSCSGALSRSRPRPFSRPAAAPTAFDLQPRGTRERLALPLSAKDWPRVTLVPRIEVLIGCRVGRLIPTLREAGRLPSRPGHAGRVARHPPHPNIRCAIPACSCNRRPARRVDKKTQPGRPRDAVPHGSRSEKSMNPAPGHALATLAFSASPSSAWRRGLGAVGDLRVGRASRRQPLERRTLRGDLGGREAQPRPAERRIGRRLGKQ